MRVSSSPESSPQSGSAYMKRVRGGDAVPPGRAREARDVADAEAAAAEEEEEEEGEVVVLVADVVRVRERRVARAVRYFGAIFCAIFFFLLTWRAE